MPIVRIGICAPRSCTKSNRPVPTSGSRLRAQNARTLSSSAFIRLGVNTRDISPRCTSWLGGSSMRMLPGRQLHAGLDEVERRPLAGPVGVPVLHGRLDVGEAAQGPEVVPLVEPERRLVPHPPPDRVRVLVDLDVERVVVEVVRRRSARSWCPSFLTPSSTTTLDGAAYGAQHHERRRRWITLEPPNRSTRAGGALHRRGLVDRRDARRHRGRRGRAARRCRARRPLEGPALARHLR